MKPKANVTIQSKDLAPGELQEVRRTIKRVYGQDPGQLKPMRGKPKNKCRLK